MQWSIEQGGVSTNCEAVGALAVSFRATQPDASITEIDSFLCGSGTASRVLEADTWDIELLLIGSGSVTLDGPLRTDDVVVTAGGDTDIGLIVFTVE
jgi:hypothetical protein